jgi:hypothetical protein
MNFARTFGPDLVGGDLTALWVYAAGPLLGAIAAVLLAFLLRGRGGGWTGSKAAQGTIETEVSDPEAPIPGTAKPGKKGKKAGKGNKKAKASGKKGK